MSAQAQPECGGRVRLVSLAFAAARGIPLTTAYIRQRFGVSRATAKRDMALIRDRLIRLNPRQK